MENKGEKDLKKFEEQTIQDGEIYVLVVDEVELVTTSKTDMIAFVKEWPYVYGYIQTWLNGKLLIEL